MTALGRVVLDGWLFGFIPESEDCQGWDMARMQLLMNRVNAAWDQYGNLTSRLPSELRERQTELYARAPERAQERGWTRNSATTTKHRGT